MTTSLCKTPFLAQDLPPRAQQTGPQFGQLIHSAGTLQVLHDQASPQVPSYVSRGDHNRDWEWPDTSQKERLMSTCGGTLVRAGSGAPPRETLSLKEMIPNQVCGSPLGDHSCAALSSSCSRCPPEKAKPPTSPWPNGMTTRGNDLEEIQPEFRLSHPAWVFVCGRDTTSPCLRLFFVFPLVTTGSSAS